MKCQFQPVRSGRFWMSYENSFPHAGQRSMATKAVNPPGWGREVSVDCMALPSRLLLTVSQGERWRPGDSCTGSHGNERQYILALEHVTPQPWSLQLNEIQHGNVAAS